MKQPKSIELSAEEIEGLKQRLMDNSLSLADKELLKGILDFSCWLQQVLSEAKITIKKLQSLVFGAKTEKKTATEKSKTPRENTSKLAKKGHGRYKANCYTGATIESVPSGFKKGDLCPQQCGGKLYLISPGIVIRIRGGQMASAIRYELEKLRCALCGFIVTAALPKEASVEKYDISLRTQLCIFKYYLGMPFYRIQMAQSMVGIPLPDATQWDLIRKVIKIMAPIYNTLQLLAAQGKTIWADDTIMRVLSLLKENTIDLKRKGIYTTGISVQFEERFIHLFMTGRNNAGENAGQLLNQRLNSETVFYMSDASSASQPEGVLPDILIKLIICSCLVHGRRKFYELLTIFPEVCQSVIDKLAIIYENDAYCKQHRLTMEERLAYHQKESTPLMLALHQWLHKQKELIEPNSALGKAIQYMLNHWEKMTRFLTIAGAPLDNNIVERTLKIAIRNRKNAYFYKTEKGAEAGDILMSIIHTCVANEINPVDYLTECQKHPEEVANHPDLWLPWNYKKFEIPLANTA